MSWEDNRWILASPFFRLRELKPAKEYGAEIVRGGGIGDLMRTWFSYVLLARGGILLHSAGVVRSGRALVFCGPSGSGKTTLARLAGSQPLLSDESVAIVRGSSRHKGRRVFYACGTPFFGELVHGSVNRCVPIGEIFLINPDRFAAEADNHVAPIDPSLSLAQLLAQTFLRKLSTKLLNIILPLLDELIGSVRVRRLEFSPTLEIWKFLDDTSR